ncbi:MAG: cytidine deaminase [Mycoplasma sp.]|nr:cytidine deaminase [Mycoplasma sp.]
MLNKLLKLQKNAYSPYSKFKVAAILVSNSDKEYVGVNIENSAYGVTICAERSALFSAISQGEKPGFFKEIHIIGGEGEDIITPCGPCRQVLLELAPNSKIIQYSSLGEKRINTIKELLPFGFTKDKLQK